jgi:hypothetical protein
MKTTFHSKKISERKLVANRENAQKSAGPHNCDRTRYNAAKHGLLAEGVTEMDDPASFRELCSRLEAEFGPVGEVEIALVRHVAICIVRLRRAWILEAEFITAMLNPALTETVYPDGKIPEWTKIVEQDYGKTVVTDAGLPCRLGASDVEGLVNTFQRYETAIENKLYRALNQLERLQRMRRGDAVPPPASLDVNVHSERNVASFGNSPQE